MAGRVRGYLSAEIPTRKVRELRRSETPAERAAWWLLRKRGTGLKFRRQHAIGRYVVDFYCFEHRLAVELDGSAHSQPSQMKKDSAKDSYLRGKGIRVLRTNGQVLEDPEGFLSEIRAASLAL